MQILQPSAAGCLSQNVSRGEGTTWNTAAMPRPGPWPAQGSATAVPKATLRSFWPICCPTLSTGKRQAAIKLPDVRRRGRRLNITHTQSLNARCRCTADSADSRVQQWRPGAAASAASIGCARPACCQRKHTCGCTDYREQLNLRTWLDLKASSIGQTVAQAAHKEACEQVHLLAGCNTCMATT